MIIPITKPYITGDEEKEVVKVLRSGWLAQGPRTEKLEKMFSGLVGSKYAVAFNSCTSALHTALLLSGVGPGDEVIVPSFSFIATANSVLHTGATPVFVDIDERTYNIAPEKIEKAITKRTKVIMPVHQLGLPADMDTILKTAGKHNLKVIEDAACAIGSEYKGRKIGSISGISCFSFHPRKVITTGEGGMLTTGSKSASDKAKIIRSHGASISDLARHSAKKVLFEKYTVLGYNYRISDLEAAVGIMQLKKLPHILERRRKLAERYSGILGKIDCLEVPYVPGYAKPNFQSYIVRLKKNSPKTQKQVIQEMQKKGIATRPGVMAIHLEPLYRKKYEGISLPVTEECARSTVLLPLFPQMSEKEQVYVIENLEEVLKK